MKKKNWIALLLAVLLLLSGCGGGDTPATAPGADNTTQAAPNVPENTVTADAPENQPGDTPEDPAETAPLPTEEAAATQQPDDTDVNFGFRVTTVHSRSGGRCCPTLISFKFTGTFSEMA